MQTTITTQLMKNHVPGTVLQKQKYLKVAYKPDGSPCLFSLDEAGQLNVTLPSIESPTGWEQVNLTGQLAKLGTLGDSPVVQCFSVSQDIDGSIWLAFGASNAQNGPSNVFLCNMENTGLVSDWSSLGQRLVNYPVGRDIVLSHITIGTDDDMATAPLIIAVGTEPESGMVAHYQINPDLNDTSWRCMPLILPQNATRCLASAVGNVQGLGRGVYALCELGPGLNLTFTTMPQLFSGHLVTQSLQLAIPDGLMPNSIAALAVDEGYSELYVAGNGLVRYPLSAQTESNLPATSIADSVQFNGIAHLIVDRDAAGIEIGIMGVNNRDQLVYTVGTHNGQDYVWQAPVFVASEVTAIATCRTYDPDTNITIANVATGKTDGSFSLVTQDSGTMLWRSQAISIKSNTDVVEISTYTIRIVIMDDDGIAMNEQTVGLQPSFDCAALVNGQYYALKSSVAKTAKTTAAGTITIVLQTPDTSAPTFTVTAGSIIVPSMDPTASVVSKLRAISDRNQIKNAVRSDGKPVFPNGIEDRKCDQAVDSLGLLIKSYDSLSATPPSGHLRRAAVVAAASEGANFRQFRRVSCTGFHLHDDSAIIMQHEDALAALTARDGLREFWVAAGDLFASLGSRIESVATFFVNMLESAWEFVVEVGDRLLHFIFEVASQVFAAVKWVFKEVLGIDLDDLIAWLGFVFNWSDILNNHKVIAKTINLALQKTVVDIQDTKVALGSAFDTVRSNLINGKLIVDQSNAMFAKRVRNVPVQESAADSAEANWGLHQLDVNSSSITQSNTVIGDIENLFTNLTDTQILIIQNAVSQFQTEIMNNFDRMSFGEILTKFVDIVGVLLIDTAENVAITFLDAVQLLVAAFQALLNTRWNIPVLTYVYEEIICKGDGSKLTLLDVIALLTAIPATILYKSVTGTNLFTTDQMDRALAANAWGDFVGVFSNSQSTHVVCVGATGGANVKGISPMEAAALAFQCTATACRIVTATLSVISDFMEKCPRKDYIARVKVGFDWASFACSIVNFSIIAATKEKLTTRYVLDGMITTSQILLRIKDTFLVVWNYNNNGKDSPLRKALSYMESVFGVGIAVATCVSLSLQAKEDVPVGVDPFAAGILISLKFSQNFYGNIYSALAFMPNLEDPKLQVVGIAIRGSLTLMRAVVSTGRIIGEPIASYVDVDQ